MTLEQALEKMKPREWVLSCHKDSVWWYCVKTPDNAQSVLGEVTEVIERSYCDKLEAALKLVINQRNSWLKETVNCLESNYQQSTNVLIAADNNEIIELLMKGEK